MLYKIIYASPSLDAKQRCNSILTERDVDSGGPRRDLPGHGLDGERVMSAWLQRAELRERRLLTRHHGAGTAPSRAATAAATTPAASTRYRHLVLLELAVEYTCTEFKYV